MVLSVFSVQSLFVCLFVTLQFSRCLCVCLGCTRTCLHGSLQQFCLGKRVQLTQHRNKSVPTFLALYFYRKSLAVVWFRTGKDGL